MLCEVLVQVVLKCSTSVNARQARAKQSFCQQAMAAKKYKNDLCVYIYAYHYIYIYITISIYTIYTYIYIRISVCVRVRV